MTCFSFQWLQLKTNFVRSSVIDSKDQAIIDMVDYLDSTVSNFLQKVIDYESAKEMAGQFHAAMSQGSTFVQLRRSYSRITIAHVSRQEIANHTTAVKEIMRFLTQTVKGL